VEFHLDVFYWSKSVKFMKLSSVKSTFGLFWRAKNAWRKPSKAKVLIIDRTSSEIFLSYLDPKCVEIMDRREEKINYYVLFKCLLKWRLSFLDYKFEYLKCVKPKVALTFIHNDSSFYLLKDHQKDLTTAFVQNGSLRDMGNIFGFSEMQSHCRNKYNVDYMLVFGDAVGRECAKYIEGDTISIGSFRNNFYQTNTQKVAKSVLFLSSYRESLSSEGSSVFTDNQWITWKQFYSAEECLLPLLQKYCLQNELELKICMSSDSKHERNYYRSLLGSETCALLPGGNSFSSYKNVHSAEFVVSLGSTLGYEALALGKKTAEFALRGKLLRVPSRNFGWPADLPDKGPFWTNHADEREVKRVMDYITKVTDEEWEQSIQCYIRELMQYDPGNTRFLKLMREIGVPLKREYNE